MSGGSTPPTLGPDLGAALRSATSRLAEAGVPSPQADAVALAAHLLDSSYSEIRRLAVLGAPTPSGYDELVSRRADRVPLQHLTGRAAFRRLELAVGPGVFVPRPETEVLVDLVLEELAGHDAPLVVDLCTGSGAIALAVADEAPTAHVWAVELSPEAHAWAARNVAEGAERGRVVTLLLGDAAEPSDPGLGSLQELAGCVDVVTCNPPYIPDGMVPLDPEVRRHDPELALCGRSVDGLAVPLAMARRAASLLRPGGLLAMEHADAQGRTLPAALSAQGFWRGVRDVDDLAGRPRVTLARRA